MVDHLSKERRSENMRRIKNADTQPEMIVRRCAHSLGYRYRLHQKNLPGKPDMVFAGRRSIIFVHGCFWHQHPNGSCGARRPKSNKGYWKAKLDRNVARDAEHAAKLKAEGWRILTIWECETNDASRLATRLRRFLR